MIYATHKLYNCMHSVTTYQVVETKEGRVSDIYNFECEKHSMLWYDAIILSKKDIKKEGISMNGLINNNLDVIKAMEKENAGIFIPEYKEKKSNPSFVPEEAFDTIFDYIEKLAVDMGQTLHSGNIEVDPVDTSLEACKYCMYSSVCGIEDKEHKQGKKINNDEVFEEMRGGEEHGL